VAIGAVVFVGFMPPGRFSHAGHSSVRKIEMPKLKGMATAMAMREVITVP